MSFLSGLVGKKKQIAPLPPPPAPEEHLVQVDDLMDMQHPLGISAEDRPSPYAPPPQRQAPHIDYPPAPEFSQPAAEQLSPQAQFNPTPEQPTFSQSNESPKQQSQYPDFSQQETPQQPEQDAQNPWATPQVQPEAPAEPEWTTIKPLAPENAFQELTDETEMPWDDSELPDFTEQEMETAKTLEEPPEPTPEPVYAHLPFMSTDKYLTVLHSANDIDTLIEKLNTENKEALSLHETEQVRLDQMIDLLNTVRDGCLRCDETIATAER